MKIYGNKCTSILTQEGVNFVLQGSHATYYTVTAAWDQGHINENCLKGVLKADGVILVEQTTLDGNLSGMFRFFIALGNKTWQYDLENRLSGYGLHVQSSHVANPGAKGGGDIYKTLATPGSLPTTPSTRRS